jgi:hypothetical protein
MELRIPPRSKDPDDGRVDAVFEELNELDTDLAMQRESRTLRAGRIVATVEQFAYDEVARHLREHGLTNLAHHYECKADRAETQSSLKGHE